MVVLYHLLCICSLSTVLEKRNNNRAAVRQRIARTVCKCVSVVVACFQLVRAHHSSKASWGTAVSYSSVVSTPSPAFVRSFFGIDRF